MYVCVYYSRSLPGKLYTTGVQLLRQLCAVAAVCCAKAHVLSAGNARTTVSSEHVPFRHPGPRTTARVCPMHTPLVPTADSRSTTQYYLYM